MTEPTLTTSVKVGQLVLQQLLDLGASAPPAELSQLQPADLAAARAATNDQIGRRRPPMVPEFKTFVRLTGPLHALPPTNLKAEWPIPSSIACEPAISHLPPGSKVVGPSLSARGDDKEVPSLDKAPGDDDKDVPSLDKAPLDCPADSSSPCEGAEKLAKSLASQPGPIAPRDMERLCRSLPLESPHRGKCESDGSFRAGMYIKGGIVGLHKSCRTHPWSNKAISRFVAEQSASIGFSSHFTSAVVLVNTRTEPHRDIANAGEDNIIIPVSRFDKGGVWIEHHNGPDVRPVGDKSLPGMVLNFGGKPITIDAKNLYHSTEPWEGDRIIISAYTLRDTTPPRPQDADELRDLGFLSDPDHVPQTHPSCSASRVITVGIPWTPEEFVTKACGANHPGNIVTGIPSLLQEVIQKNASESPASLGQFRTASLRKWAARARDLNQDELDYRCSMPSHCQRVLSSKRLCLFKEILDTCGHGDVTLVDEVSQGFRLSGAIPDSHVFRAKRTTASMSTDELKSTSSKMRDYILGTCKSSGDPELDIATYDATKDELERGWLWGPVSASSLPEDAILTRRFGIWQSSGDQKKCRPIDNYRESLVNLTTSANETISIHSADTIAAGIAFDMRASRDVGKPRSLLMKAWDLRKAYKNLPLHESSLHESYLCVYDPGTQTTQIFGQFVLPFGARSSVHGFCRVSAALWLAGVSMLRLHWYSYFDDFPTIEPEQTCPMAQMGVDFLFTLLGWETSSEKNSPFASVCKILGLEYNLEETKLGTLVIKNTAKRYM